MNLIARTGKFIEKEKLFSKKDRLLVAVSGGIDSIVVLHILNELGYSTGVAHVNYGLRDNDSDGDERFVEQVSKSMGVPFYTKHLNSQETAALREGNLQQNARELRYAYFNQLAADHSYSFICTGHHADDRAETFVLHSMRSSGISGLRSIQASSKNVRRPLLFSNKEEIIALADDLGLKHRDDRSNSSLDYDRNFIRNQLFPKYNERWSNVSHRLNKTIDRLQDQEKLYLYLMDKEATRWINTNRRNNQIGPVSKLRMIPGTVSFLHYVLKDYGFNLSDLEDMLEANESGKVFLSRSHEATLDRDHLIIRKKTIQTFVSVEIHGPGQFNLPDGRSFKIEEILGFKRSKDPNVEVVDGSKLRFPLLVRSWQPNDRFQPLGMKGQTKKLSDLFADLKLNKFQKEDTLVLSQGEQIIWVLGCRMDDNFSTRPETKSFFKLTISDLK